MSEMWKQWVGRTVDGKFLLESYLGGSDRSAVFLTTVQVGSGGSSKAAIKLIAADPATREEQLERWNASRELSHPNLIRIFEAGPCVLDGGELLYVVEEYAEENLSQILPERALTAEEARGMLSPVLRALQFLHDKGFVHGRIHPSSIFAIGEEVKLASDTLRVPGEASRGAGVTGMYDPPEASAGRASASLDVWQLGMTLIEVLTQRLPVWDRARSGAPEIPASLPAPFGEIAAQCLQVDPGKRWTIADTLKRLEPGQTVVSSSSSPSSLQPAQAPSLRTKTIKTGKTPSAPAIAGSPKPSAKWPYMVGLAVVVAVAFFLVARPKISGPAEGPSTASQSAVAESSQPGQGLAQQTETAGGQETSAADSQSGIVRRVTPEVSPGARRTIHGTIKVRVKVTVDAAGNVTQAKVESGRVSKYFSRLTLDAAREWKFSPAQGGESGARRWSLQFAFSRTKTEVSAVRAR